MCNIPNLNYLFVKKYQIKYTSAWSQLQSCSLKTNGKGWSSKNTWTSCLSSNKRVSILPRGSHLTSVWKSKVEWGLIMSSRKALNILEFVDLAFIKWSSFTASSRTSYTSLERLLDVLDVKLWRWMQQWLRFILGTIFLMRPRRPEYIPDIYSPPSVHSLQQLDQLMHIFF